MAISAKRLEIHLRTMASKLLGYAEGLKIKMILNLYLMLIQLVTKFLKKINSPSVELVRT